MDYDGTMTVQDSWPDHGEIRDGMVNLWKDLEKDGNVVILWTNRENKHLETALNYLATFGIFPKYINENPPCLQEKYENDPRKLGADIFIDDKTIGFSPDSNILRTELYRKGFLSFERLWESK